MNKNKVIILELTSEESLTQKANYAREMAKAVNSAQFKKKRLLAQKQAPKIEEKVWFENIASRASKGSLICDYTLL